VISNGMRLSVFAQCWRPLRVSVWVVTVQPNGNVRP
jgi:hypothetical protein